MPVSLGRRLRRIGIPQKEHRTEDWKPAKHSVEYREAAVDLINAARKRRELSKDNTMPPSQPHRRSRSRLKRGREDAKGYPTAGSKKR